MNYFREIPENEFAFFRVYDTFPVCVLSLNIISQESSMKKIFLPEYRKKSIWYGVPRYDFTFEGCNAFHYQALEE